jgi:hypothetical protein
VLAAGTGLGAEASAKLSQLVHAGVELVRMVLGTGGPDAALLLTAGMPPTTADGTSPADSLQQWQVVATRVALTPEQRLALADWRRRFLQQIDDCYGRRLLHKAQVGCKRSTQLGLAALQTASYIRSASLQAVLALGRGCWGGHASNPPPPPPPHTHTHTHICHPPPHTPQLTQLPGASLNGQAQQWVEVLLMQAAENVGFSGTRCCLPPCLQAAACCGCVPAGHGPSGGCLS